MKIRIIYDDYPALKKEIKDRVGRAEFDTWQAVKSKSDSGYDVIRIVHNGKDDQYSMIEIGFFSPSVEDRAQKKYVDLIPKKKPNDKISDVEFIRKSQIVMGRLCELLNSHFPNINEYTVYTK